MVLLGLRAHLGTGVILAKPGLQDYLVQVVPLDLLDHLEFKDQLVHLVVVETWGQLELPAQEATKVPLEALVPPGLLEARALEETWVRLGCLVLREAQEAEVQTVRKDCRDRRGLQDHLDRAEMLVPLGNLDHLDKEVIVVFLVQLDKLDLLARRVLGELQGPQDSPGLKELQVQLGLLETLA